MSPGRIDHVIDRYERAPHLTGRVAFDVAGIPVGEGNLKASPSRHLYHRSAPALAAWRHAIATEARAAMHRADLLTGPVELAVTFRLPRPLGHIGARGLRPSAPSYPTTRPDLDKLLRALLDSLTGVVFGDDAQVSSVTAAKDYAARGGQPGASVVVRERR